MYTEYQQYLNYMTGAKNLSMALALTVAFTLLAFNPVKLLDLTPLGGVASLEIGAERLPAEALAQAGNPAPRRGGVRWVNAQVDS